MAMKGICSDTFNSEPCALSAQMIAVYLPPPLHKHILELSYITMNLLDQPKTVYTSVIRFFIF